MTTSLDIDDLVVAFPTKSDWMKAVDGISFSLKPGETLALLGESGCGKSLTALALMRLLPPQALYGKTSKVVFGEQDLLNFSEQHMRTLRGQRLAIIFQEPMTALNPVLTIGEQLEEALPKKNHMSKAMRTEKLIALLTEVEITDPALRLEQYPHQLSGGQKQRVMIAMAIANQPEILIADEPTTALDVTVQAQILALLKKLQRQYNMSVLLITHDLGVVKAMADRVCLMYAGRILEIASVNAFFSEVAHPYAQQLLAALPSYKRRGQRLQAISGGVPSLDALPPGCRFHPRCARAETQCQNEEPALYQQDERLLRCHFPTPSSTFSSLPDTTASTSLKEDKEIILAAANLSVTFVIRPSYFAPVQQLKAVDDVSFALKKGETLALVGESGCGKTTLARALLLLQPFSSGEIKFMGQSVRELKGTALRNYRKRVQIIFQDPFSSMNPRMTIAEILAEGMQAQGMARRTIAQKQKLLLEQVHIPLNALSRYPHQFSGGQRQRICIARALALEPALVICDEPTSALDVSVQAQILNLLKDLQQELGMAYLFISHNMAVVSYLADNIIVMKQGQIVEKGTCEEILYHPQQPYTRTLLESVL